MQNITLDAALLQKNGEDISAALAEIISTTPDNTHSAHRSLFHRA